MGNWASIKASNFHEGHGDPIAKIMLKLSFFFAYSMINELSNIDKFLLFELPFMDDVMKSART